MRALVVWLSVSACGFAPALGTDASTSGGDGRGSDIADRSNVLPAPLHLTSDDGQPSDVDLVLSGPIVVATSSLTITSIPVPTGTVDVRLHVLGNGDVAVLHLRSFTVAACATVQIVGARPLI